MLTVEKLMQSNPRTVSPDMTLVNLERLFLSTKFMGFPVVEEDRLVGVISRSDIIRSLVTERSRAEQISDFYCGAPSVNADDPTESLEACAAQVGVRLAEKLVQDAMSRNVVSIESSESLQGLAKLMTEGHLHRLPVVNGGRLVGLITTMDLVGAIAEGRLGDVGENTDTRHLLA
jgi:CBS domain-containing protein